MSMLSVIVLSAAMTIVVAHNNGLYNKTFTAILVYYLLGKSG
jgi:hypothetical protein